METIQLYFVSPAGYEQFGSIVPAPSSEIALTVAYEYPSIKELVDMGAELSAVNVSHALLKKGYSVLVSKVGMFH